ncbi:MAG: hypothetical protein JO199_12655 [Candidatus Eremiobacteraeota bacterium]|nr:hypothetical protein [Candidatus Eremiobacteraeota bacterium]
MRKLTAFILAAFALSACGGGTQNNGVLPGPNAVSSHPGTSAGTTASPSLKERPPKRKPHTALVRFFITVPKYNSARAGKHAHYIPAHAVSILITLNTVNNNPPPAGLATSAGTNLSNCSSGCTVQGPNSPIGTDNFTLNIFDATNEGGNKIATATGNVTVTAGLANTGNITMQGIPHTFALVGSMPTGTGNTAFANASTLAVNVEDIDNDIITGTYAQPVTVADSDTLSLTHASGLTLTGAGGSCASPTTTVQLNTSTDASNLALCYGGEDIAPATISGTTSIVTTPVNIGTFSPTVQPVQYTGPLNSGNNPEIDLYVANGPGGGTGSFGNWTASQSGWTNAPYSQTISETDNCDSNGNLIATFAQGGSPLGTSWQANAVAGPAVGTCTLTMHGGGAATLGVTTTYTTTGIGINLKRHPFGTVHGKP